MCVRSELVKTSWWNAYELAVNGGDQIASNLNQFPPYAFRDVVLAALLTTLKDPSAA